MIMHATPRRPRRFLLLLILALLLPAGAAYAQRGGQGSAPRPRYLPGTGNPDDGDTPPWRYVEKEPYPLTTPITLYWLPATNEEMDQSLLNRSHVLLVSSDRCVALEAVVPDDEAMQKKLGVVGKLPIAVLVDRNGRILRQAENTAGVLKPAAVEQIVTDELNARDSAMLHDIIEAQRQADAGNKQEAIDLYRRIWDDRCLYPLAGQQAQGALKSLGVVVSEPVVPPPPDPNLNIGNPTPKKKHGHE